MIDTMLSQDLLAACPFLPDWMASKALLPTKTCSRSFGVVQRVARRKRGSDTELGRRDEKKRLDCKGVRWRVRQRQTKAAAYPLPIGVYSHTRMERDKAGGEGGTDGSVDAHLICSLTLSGPPTHSY